MSGRARVAAMIVGALLVHRLACRDADAPLTIATFNIRDYPESALQEAGAFAALRATDASVIAVEEITDPARFTAATRRELGPGWSTVFADVPAGAHRVGLLFDARTAILDRVRTDHETELGGGLQPTLEVRLLPRHGAPLRIFVVHLRSGGGGRDTRRAQLAALEPLLAAARGSGDRVITLGDFNTTGAADRTDLADLADHLDLTWASRALPCTEYWQRADGCVGSALDHVLSSAPVEDIHAAGPCATEGCALRPRCPAFHAEVSDHCPVVARLR